MIKGGAGVQVMVLDEKGKVVKKGEGIKKKGPSTRFRQSRMVGIYAQRRR